MLQVAFGAATARGSAAPAHTAVQLHGTMGIRSSGSRRTKRFSKGDYAVAISGHYRVVFRFEDGDAYDVDVVDYHKS